MLQSKLTRLLKASGGVPPPTNTLTSKAQQCNINPQQTKKSQVSICGLPKQSNWTHFFALKRKLFGGICWSPPHCPQCAITKKIIWWSGGDGEEDVCPNIIIMAEGGGGTYKTQMADNRIISLLHPLPAHAIPKISFFNFSHNS